MTMSAADDDEVPQYVDPAASLTIADRRLLEVDEIPPEAEFDAGGRRRVRNRVPLTLLTGYLGAGKSTLLEYVTCLCMLS